MISCQGSSGEVIVFLQAHTYTHKDATTQYYIKPLLACTNISLSAAQWGCFAEKKYRQTIFCPSVPFMATLQLLCNPNHLIWLITNQVYDLA